MAENIRADFLGLVGESGGSERGLRGAGDLSEEKEEREHW